MKRRLSGLAILSPFAIFSLLGACSSEGAPGPRAGEAVSALEDAPEDPGHKFSVGVCGGALSNGASGTCLSSRCTGTLIAPNLVLTARHCLNFPTMNELTELCTNDVANFFDDSTLKPPSSMHVTVDPSTIEGNPRWYDVSEILLPDGSHVCHDDVALLRLTRNVPAAEAEPVAPDVFTNLAEHTPSAVTIVGRGAIENTWDPVTGERLTFDNGGFRRRILQNIPVMCVSDRDGDCGTLLDYTILEPPRGFTLTSGVILFDGPSSHPGDSGSGLLDQAKFNVNKHTVVGVMSYGGVDENGIDYANFAVRLDYHMSFLVRAAHDAAKIGGYPTPDWVNFPGTPCGTNYCQEGYVCCESCPGICREKDGGACPTSCNPP